MQYNTHLNIVLSSPLTSTDLAPIIGDVDINSNAFGKTITDINIFHDASATAAQIIGV